MARTPKKPEPLPSDCWPKHFQVMTQTLGAANILTDKYANTGDLAAEGAGPALRHVMEYAIQCHKAASMLAYLYMNRYEPTPEVITAFSALDPELVAGAMRYFSPAQIESALQVKLPKRN